MNVKKIFLILGGFIALLVISTVIFLASFDVDKYRGTIVDMLGKQTGRTVTLGGPVKLGLSTSGLTLAIRDAAIGNPPWAARATMAGIGKFELGVAFMPLLAHRLEITHVTIANADIQLETGANNQHNWEFQPAAGVSKAPADNKIAPKQTSAGGDVSISLEKLSITDSQIAMRGADGKTTAVKAKNVKFSMTSGGLTLDFYGDYNNTPVTLTAKADTGNIMGNSDFPFTLKLDYASYDVQANGTANLGAKKASIKSYAIKAGKTELHGQMLASWAAQPRLQGNVAAEKIDMADFKTSDAGDSSKPAASGGEAPASHQRYMLSEAPLNLSGLKAADATIDFTVAEFPLGDTALTQIAGKLNLAGGQLDLPFKAKMGGSDLSGKIQVNGASVTPQIGMTFSAPSLELADGFKAAKLPALLSDTANIQITLGGSGGSLHAIAGSANGVMNITGGAGKVSASAAGALGSGLAAIFSPNGSGNALECLAARFIVTNGLVHDNGILVDTSPTTIVGKGGFNLRDETIDLNLKARTKLVNVGSLLPGVHIGGTFSHPDYSADAEAMVKNVVGMLTSGSMTSDVPEVKGVAGQNACLYTLDHPTAATSSAPLIPSSLGKSADDIKNTGTQILKGLFGK